MKVVPLLSLLLATSAFAATPTSPLLTDLSRCDRSFFEALKHLAPELASQPQFASGPTFAFFKVADRSDPERSLQRFKTPIKLGKIEITGYFDELMRLGDNNVFVAWGFLLRAPIKEVIPAIQADVWDNSRLQADGDVHIRMETWDPAHPEDGWQKVATPVGMDAQADAIERELKIEPYERDASLTRFGCSLQGAVSKAMLKETRPDLAGKTPLTR